jgi:hypothetical protein
MRLPLQLATFTQAAGGFLRIATVSGLAAVLIGNNQNVSADENGMEQSELFQRVAKQLDQNGKYFLYQDKTELKRELARRFASTSAGVIYGYRSSSEDRTSRRTRVNTLIDQVSDQLTGGVAAVGESIKAGDGFYSRRTFLAPDVSTAPLAPLFPHPPSNLAALSFLPADTDFFLFHQVDPRSVIQNLRGFAEILGLSDVLPSSQALEEELNRNSGFSDTLDSIGTEFGISLALNKEAMASADPSDINILIAQIQWTVILHPDHRVVEHLKEQVAKGSSKISDCDRNTLTAKDNSGQAAIQIGLAISVDFYTRIIGNLFDGYGVSIQTDNGYRWEAHERKPSASGLDQLLTALFSMLAGFAAASH